MHPDLEELRPKLKEILYDCAVEIRATKAALYLFNGSGRFELMAEYGFRHTVREIKDSNDPIVDRAGRGNTPFFINGVGVEPRFSDILFQASTDRLLVAPIWQRAQLVGFIDMRDKAQKQLFDQADANKAQAIADRMAALFANKNFFGQRYIALSKHEDEVHPMTSRPAVVAEAKPVTLQPPGAPPRLPTVSGVPVPVLAAPALAPPPAPVPSPASPMLSYIVQQARSATSDLVIPPATARLGDAEVAAVRESLKALLLVPGLVCATFSVFGAVGGMQETAARAPLTDDGIKSLQSKLNLWVTKRGETVSPVTMNVLTPLGSSGPMLGGAQLQKVFTAPLSSDRFRGLYLTVAFMEAPDGAAHDLLTQFHRQLELAIDQASKTSTLQATRRQIAQKLLEPDFARYPELRHHTDLVLEKVDAFANYLALPFAEIENACLLAIVHDVGLRVLDYERLYKKRVLSQDELALLREHVRVGAAMVEPLLGPEIARAVLSHHERVDGRGYPNELQGAEIPYLARLLQICDVYIAITDPETYQLVEPPAAALATIGRGAGTQFDRELATRFLEMMRRT